MWIRIIPQELRKNSEDRAEDTEGLFILNYSCCVSVFLCHTLDRRQIKHRRQNQGCTVPERYVHVAFLAVR